MTDEYRQPLEETQEVADAVEDDVAVPAFITGGGPDADTPEFREPGTAPDTDSGEPGAEPVIRTGADQPWDPVDLAEAQGKDPTPENIERARQELEKDGPAAIEKTVP
jgi:hypothetical protein